MRIWHIRTMSITCSIVRLDPDRGKDERAFRVDVLGRAHVGRRQRIAAIRLMALGEHRESMHALIVDDRNQDAMVGRMRAAVIWRVVQKRVAALQHRMVVGHRPRHHSGPRSTWMGRLSAAVSNSWSRGQNDAGKVVGDRQDARSGRCGCRVFAILRAMPLNRAVSTASCGAVDGIRPQRQSWLVS